MCGWIKISREINKHWLWQDAERLKWWLDLLLMASWKDKQVMHDSHLFTLKRGQIIASVSLLSERWGKNHQTIIKFLKLLVSEKMISRGVMYRQTSIITICNYDEYQQEDTSIVDTIVDTQMDTIVDTIVYTNKEIKNINNIIVNNNACACVREEEFSSELKQDQMWLEAMAKNYGLASTQAVAEWLDKFNTNNQCRDNTHSNLSDYRKHFNDWLRIQIREIKKNQNEQNSKNRRVGSEPSQSTADYFSSF